MADRKLTLAEHQLVSILTAIVLDRVPYRDERALDLELLADVLDEVDRDHPQIAPLVVPAGRMIEAHSLGAMSNPDYHGALFDAELALRRYHRLRAATAREQRLAQTGKAA